MPHAVPQTQVTCTISLNRPRILGHLHATVHRLTSSVKRSAACLALRDCAPRQLPPLSALVTGVDTDARSAGPGLLMSHSQLLPVHPPPLC